MKFKKWDCYLQFAVYSNGRKAIQLMDEMGVVAKATINLPDEKLQDDEIIIKDYGENEGMYNALLNSGVIHPKHREIMTGHVICPIVKLVNPTPNL